MRGIRGCLGGPHAETQLGMGLTAGLTSPAESLHSAATRPEVAHTHLMSQRRRQENNRGCITGSNLRTQRGKENKTNPPKP